MQSHPAHPEPASTSSILSAHIASLSNSSNRRSEH
jgi:hypothetical protein